MLHPDLSNAACLPSTYKRNLHPELFRILQVKLEDALDKNGKSIVRRASSGIGCSNDKGQSRVLHPDSSNAVPKPINILAWNLGMYISGASSFHHHQWRGLRQLDQQTQLGMYSHWLFSCYSICHTIDEYSMHTTLNINYFLSSLDCPPFRYSLCPIFFSFLVVLSVFSFLYFFHSTFEHERKS